MPYSHTVFIWTRNTGMESTQEITEEIVCEKCGEAEEIIRLSLCINCLEARDRYEEDRMAEYMGEVE